MTEPPDYAALARQYLDLWEEHLTAIAIDPALAAQMSTMFGLMGQMMPLAMPGAMSGGTGNAIDPIAAFRQTMAGMAAGAAQTRHGGDDQARPDTRSKAGTAAAAAASGDGDEGLAELARRLAAVERQLAGAKRSAGRTRRSKPASGSRGAGKPKSG